MTGRSRGWGHLSPCPVCRKQPTVTLPPESLKKAMRRHHVTIAVLAQRLAVTQDRVREARMFGVRCYVDACAWWKAVTGKDPYSPTLSRWLREDPLTRWNVA